MTIFSQAPVFESCTIGAFVGLGLGVGVGVGAGVVPSTLIV